MNYPDKNPSQYNTKSNEKINFGSTGVVLSLLVIGVIAILIRLHYFHPDLPPEGDADIYFFYAIQTSVLGHLPESYMPGNNGWPTFLSIFFSIVQFDNLLAYMELQRLVTIFISVITIIPVYLLCNRFFEKPYSIVGAAIFAFEPHLIENSLLGVSDQPYIFLVVSTLVLFLSSKKMIYASFGVAALATMIRSEGMFLFFAISIMFFVKFRKDRIAIPKYIPALVIFILILLPMVQYRIEVTGSDLIFSRLYETVLIYFPSTEPPIQEIDLPESGRSEELGADRQSLNSLLLTGIENFPKYLGWSLIPIFIFLVPFGAILIFKNLNFRTLTIIVSTIVMLIPTFYAYSIPLLDTRYITFLYPVFCVISIFTVEKFVNRFKNRKLVIILIISSILISSVIFLDFRKIDYEYEKEAFEIAQQIVEKTDGINRSLNYLKIAPILAEWPDPKFDENTGVILSDFTRISAKGFDSLENFIEESKDEGLTHLTLDGNQQNEFFNDVFYHEQRYPYLIEEYDSVDYGYNYQVKIYRIDYEKFEATKQGQGG